MMTPKVRKRAAAVAVRPRVDETLAPQTGANTSADSVGAKAGGDAPRPTTPWPTEFGWDFPFDFPKPAR